MAIKPVSQKIVKTIQQEIEFKQKMSQQVDSLNHRVQIERVKTHHTFVKEMAEKAGIDYNKAIEQGLRRNKAQRRFVDREYKQLRERAKKRIKEDTKKQLLFEKEYYEKFLADMPLNEGNPCLILWEPDPLHPPDGYAVEDDPGPGGMIGSGCREPRLSSHQSETNFQLASEYSHRNHLFYPRNFVRTGEDDSHVWQKTIHLFVLGRRPLDRGRGNFFFWKPQIWISGIGYCELRPGDLPIGHGIVGASSEARVEVHIVLIQRYDHAPDGYLYTWIFSDDCYWARYNRYCGEVRIEPYVPYIEGMRILPWCIYGPDQGGHEIYVFFNLTTYVGAYLEEAQAELDFSQPYSEGIHLADVRLCGLYTES
jgi:hypothetical protein